MSRSRQPLKLKERFVSGTFYSTFDKFDKLEKGDETPP